jgi:Outer membrane protein beta-barrel domain
MKFLLATLSFLFSISSVFSQDNFANGYIVNHSGDTLKGLIHRAIEEDLFGSVQFKGNQSASPRNILPGEIELFAMDEDIFRSVSFLNTSLDNAQQDSCFAKQLVLGKYELYTFTRKEKRFYIVRSGNNAQLIFDTYYTNMGDAVQEGNFLTRMRLIMNECPEVSRKYQSFEFGQKQMTGYIESLDRCLAPASVKSFYHRTKTDMNFYAYFGGLPVPEYEQFCGEIGLRFNSPLLSQKTFLNIDFRYSYINTIDHDNDSNYPNIIYTTTQENRIYSIPVTIQYDFIIKRIRPYAYGGFSVLYNNVTKVSDIPYMQPATRFNFSPVFGIGVEGYITNRLFLKADWRYEVFLQYPNLCIGYLFK